MKIFLAGLKIFGYSIWTLGALIFSIIGFYKVSLSSGFEAVLFFIIGLVLLLFSIVMIYSIGEKFVLQKYSEDKE